MTIPIGADASTSHTVTEDDTAIALGSGDVPVLATPRLLAWCEAATVAALADHLDDGATSVGYRIELDHLLATPVGGTVGILAEVVAVDGRHITFSVQTEAEAGTAATGTIVRVVVDRQRFVDRLA